MKKILLPLFLAIGFFASAQNNQSLDQSTQVGIIAQEVQKFFPELVKENATGELSVNYSGLIPLLITSIKEQQQLIEKQQKQIETISTDNKGQRLEMKELKKAIEEATKGNSRFENHR